MPSASSSSSAYLYGSAALKYIQIYTSNYPNAGYEGGRFRVIEGGYERGLAKRGTIDAVLDGSDDVQVGGIHEMRSYAIRIRHTELDGTYVPLGILEMLWRLNNPMATKSNRLKFIDHRAIIHDAYLVGNWEESLMAVFVEGSQAWYIIRVTLLVVS